VFCPDKKRLLDAYQYVTQKYSAAVAQLNQKMGTSSKADYDALYRMTEALRQDAADAQQDLERHIGTHRC
jgi:hypothetical protein